MFLKERMASLFVYAMALFLACLLIGFVKKNQYKTVLALYLIALCVFAFCYKPYVTADLYRLRLYIQYWIHSPWPDIIGIAARHRNPAWVMYSYTLSKLGNINWLQTVTCLWCFGNVFYIIAHEIEREMLTGSEKGMLLFFIMAVGAFYIQTISGLRSMLGISVTAFCFYREVIEKKRITPHLILYFFAALLHSASMLLVIFRFLYLVFQYRELHRRLAVSLAILLLGGITAYYLRDYIMEAVETGQGYLETGGEYSYFWEIIIGLMETALTVYILCCFRKRIERNRMTEGFYLMWKVCLIWTVISTAALPLSYSIFRRYTIFCTILALPLFSHLMGDERRHGIKSRFRQTVYIVLLMIFALSGVRGDLCGYKFFEL